jgi:hypothetical protein
MEQMSETFRSSVRDLAPALQINMKNAVFWNVMQRGFRKKRRFGGTYVFHHQTEKNRLTRNNVSTVLRLLVTSNVGPSLLIFLTLMLDVIRSSERSVFTRATLCHIPEDGILQSNRRENLKSYIELIGWAL